MSLRAMEERTGINRATLARVENGTARMVSVRTYRAALDLAEHEMGMDMPAAEAEPESVDLVEFEVEGKGFRVVVKGPVPHLDELQVTVLSLMEGLQNEPGTTPKG